MATVASPGLRTTRASQPVREGFDAREWGTLFRAGAFAAFGVIAFVPLQLAVLLIWPLPTDVLGWFARLQENAMAGLLDMDALMLVDYLLFALLFVALFVILRDASPSVALVMVTLELIAVTLY